MIFAEIQYEQHYSEVHARLVDILSSTFPDLESGLQGDSWVWICEGDEKVEIDTFHSMQHQIKSSSRAGKLAHKIIDVLASHYHITVYQEPEPEPRE